MNDIINLQKKIIPEMIEILDKRYNILRTIYHNKPIGRRTLASYMDLGERAIRTEVNILKKQGLLEIQSMGMNVTEEGIQVIEELKGFIYQLKGLSNLEDKLKELLNLKNIFVVPGNFDKDEYILSDIGKEASKHILNVIKDNNILGITGGTTMAKVAEEMPKSNSIKDILVLPARGGIGKSLETQSNNIAANIAYKLDGKYKLLHIPDNIGKEALDTLMQFDEIKSLIDSIKKIDVLVFGIGRSDTMAERRNLSKDIIDILEKEGAVSEAFGYYFNINGEIIRESNTVGLNLEDFKSIRNVIGIAAGAQKAEAIIAIAALRNDITLLIDEGAAKEILNKIK
ncbi:sugar-binding transcriptional regulator [Clostridium sp. D2Q-11]|uniref:Sugar-binding transcriptional regulator n=1 Tax=Anaeromonas frigoriresistens TaxID=2683708 RepID=A0A942Z5T3_9FIRM|nr:sugar-binding domain-containing protein [Anaeromonas frigoriresistens]MBS4537771.1 sugar-binding transcriptional regulator [Anaeromonas frigoriresistens]